MYSTLTLDGRHYIDTSDESASATDLERTRSPDHTVSFVAADLNERLRLTSASRMLDFMMSRQKAFQRTRLHTLPPHHPRPASHLLIASLRYRRLKTMRGRSLRKYTRWCINCPSVWLRCSDHANMSATPSHLQMNTLTLEHAKVFNNTVHDTCDQVDQCIKNTYQLMAKFEELSLCAQQMPRLAQNMFVPA